MVKASSLSWCARPVRQDDRRDYTKHIIRLRHASQIHGGEANEIILLNSRDGTSSYQMLAGKVDRLWINTILAIEVSGYAHSAMT